MTPAKKPTKTAARKKTASKFKLRTKCDKLCGDLIRARGACENCGGTDVIQWAHGYSRRYMAIRWDERNSFALCRSCHFYFTNRPIEWDDWMKERMGEELYDHLRRLAMRGGWPDMDALYIRLKALHAELADV